MVGRFGQREMRSLQNKSQQGQTKVSMHLNASAENISSIHLTV
jgi:hypothetical protein